MQPRPGAASRGAVDGGQAVRAAWAASYAGLVAAMTAVTGDRAEAEDVVQEAFARALVAWRSGAPDNPEAWLRTVALNAARTRWRRLRRGLALTVAELTVVDRNADVPGLSPDRVALLAALRRLPHGQREAVAMHHLADLPVAEVAALLGVAEGTVKARLSRGRAALAVLLDDRADDSANASANDRAQRVPPAAGPYRREEPNRA